MKTGGWLRDFELGGGEVRLRKTGAGLRLNRTLCRDAAQWFGWWLTVLALTVGRRADGPSVVFRPDRPRPWYVVWAACRLAGLRIVDNPESADVAFRFEDVTVAPPLAGGRLRTLNADCLDISKSRVAAVFAEVFGYPLAVDPETWTGEAVEKGELNGRHDGRIVHCPTPALPGRTYARVIDTREGDAVVDLRVGCVGGEAVVVYRKRKALRDRFGIDNLTVELRQPGALFTAEELATLARFCAAMRLDWAGLDVLRERADGRLYVVDVNTTDMGPPIALPLRDKLAACRALGTALRALIEGAVDEPPRSTGDLERTPP